MAQLLLDDQLCKNHAEVIKESVSSHLDACPVQEFGEHQQHAIVSILALTYVNIGRIKTSSSCFASNAAAARA
jgi:hypothetical protein